MHSPARLTFAVSTALLIAFTTLSWTAAQTKNATVDEPGHAISGWIMWRYSDFRLAPENPSLWQLWAALPNLKRNLKIQFDGKVFSDRSFDSQGGINWARRMLYQTPGNDGEALVRRSRAMMLILGAILGAMIGCWSFRLAGSGAAMVAVGLFSFDPNFLAHSAVVKSDVALALVMFALAYAVWQLGRHASLWRVLVVGILCGVGMNTKFSGLLLLPVLAVLLVIRAMLPMPWGLRRSVAQTRLGRLVIAVSVVALATAMCVAITWTAYGFRFRPASSQTAQMDMAAIRTSAIRLEAGSALNPPRVPTPAELSAWKPGLIVRCIDLADAHHLLPQAMLGGLLYQHACMQAWPSFLLGRQYETGAWDYFPLAMLFKSPSATLIAVAMALLLMLCYSKRWIRAIADSNAAWSATCLLAPPAMFGIAALQSHLDIGLRSILPVYPFIFLGIGVISSQMIKLRPRLSRAALALLAGMLLAETLRAWPNYISFFNFPSGGQRGGFALLGDSNLDWGQDLKPLAQWQKQNPNTPVFLHYFGVADPAYFSSDFHNFEVAPNGQLVSDIPVRGGVLAVSANYLQGLYDTPNDEEFFPRLGQRPPDEIVGGSIYLYRNPWR